MWPRTDFLDLQWLLQYYTDGYNTLEQLLVRGNLGDRSKGVATCAHAVSTYYKAKNFGGVFQHTARTQLTPVGQFSRWTYRCSNLRTLYGLYDLTTAHFWRQERLKIPAFWG